MPTIFDLPPGKLSSGQTISFTYPRKNRHGRGLQLVRRTVKVVELQDASEIPIPLDAFLKRPRVRRGRWRLTAWVPELQGERTFYLDWDMPARLQLGWYDPLTHEAGERIGEPFEQTSEGLQELTGAIREILKQTPTANLALFAA